MRIRDPDTFIKAPDAEVRDKQLAQINAKIASIDKELTKVQKEWENLTTSSSSSSSNAGSDYKSLIAKLNDLRKKQSNLKIEKQTIHNKIRESEANLKSQIANIQQITNSKLGNFKTIQDIDSKINSNEDSIANSNLTLVQERSLVKENSNLRKLRKEFSNLQVTQSSIDEEKAKISEMKAKLSTISAEFKKINSDYDSTQAELDEQKKVSQESRSVKDELFHKRKELYREKDAQYEKINRIRTEFNAAYKNFKVKMELLKKQKDQEGVRLQYQMDLAEAQKPAFAREIDIVHSLLSYFDPNYVHSSSSSSSDFVRPISDPSINSKRQGRIVEAISDDLIIKKTDEVFFAGKLNNKGKKSSKSNSGGGASTKKFSIDATIVSQLNELGINLPSSQDDYPKVIEALKNKLKEFQDGEEKERERRVAVVQKKLDAFEKKLADAEKENEPEAEPKTENKE